MQLRMTPKGLALVQESKIQSLMRGLPEDDLDTFNRVFHSLDERLVNDWADWCNSQGIRLTSDEAAQEFHRRYEGANR